MYTWLSFSFAALWESLAVLLAITKDVRGVTYSKAHTYQPTHIYLSDWTEITQGFSLCQENLNFVVPEGQPQGGKEGKKSWESLVFFKNEDKLEMGWQKMLLFFFFLNLGNIEKLFIFFSSCGRQYTILTSQILNPPRFMEELPSFSPHLVSSLEHRIYFLLSFYTYSIKKMSLHSF